MEWARDKERVVIALQIIVRLKPKGSEEESLLIAARDALGTLLSLMDRRP
jgi:hypothetical protein